MGTAKISVALFKQETTRLANMHFEVYQYGILRFNLY